MLRAYPSADSEDNVVWTHDSSSSSIMQDANHCCVSVADGVYQDGTALGRGRQAGLDSAQVCAPFCVYVPQQLCSHPILLLIPDAPAAAENMGQLHVLAR